MQILIFFYVSSFIFKENHVLIEEDNPSEKILIVEVKLVLGQLPLTLTLTLTQTLTPTGGVFSGEIVRTPEELDGIDKVDIGNFLNLLRLVLINKECWNPKVVIDCVEIARNINQDKKPDVLQTCRCPLCDKCYWREYFFNKHLEYCESVR